MLEVNLNVEGNNLKRLALDIQKKTGKSAPLLSTKELSDIILDYDREDVFCKDAGTNFEYDKTTMTYDDVVSLFAGKK